MINNICINMIGTIQNDVLNKVVSEYKGNGLIDRFLFTSSESTVYNMTEHEIDDYYATTWEKLIKKVHKDSKFYLDNESTEIVKMEPEAFNVFREIDARYVEMQNSEDYSQDVKNYLSKMKTYVPRFALLLSIMHSIQDDMYIMVTEKHMRDASKIADYFISTAAKTFSNNQSSMEIREVESSLKGKTRDEKIKILHQRKFKVTAIATYFSISRTHIYRILGEKWGFKCNICNMM